MIFMISMEEDKLNPKKDSSFTITSLLNSLITKYSWNHIIKHFQLHYTYICQTGGLNQID